jgi:hypothetical protein
MGCSGCGGGTASPMYVSAGRLIDSSNPCEVVTVETLNLYKWAVDCLVASGQYARSGCSEAETLSAKNILGDWILEKEANYQSCRYMEYHPIVQDLVKRIMLSGVCQ